MVRLKVLTLNIWNINEPIMERLDKIIIFIKTNKPDIIVLQEVSRLNTGQLESEYIVEKIKYLFHSYVSTGFWKGREEGIAILSSHDFLSIKKVLLPNTLNDMQRHLLHCTIEIQNRVINLYNTHLADDIKETKIREKQILSILKYIQKNSLNELNILSGDFNDIPESRPLKILFKSKILFDTWNICNPTKDGITFSEQNKYVRSELWPNRRIDYITISKKIIVHNSSLVFTDDQIVSDHYGIYAEVEI